MPQVFDIPMVYRAVVLPILLAGVTFGGIGSVFDMISQHADLILHRDLGGSGWLIITLFLWYKYTVTVRRAVIDGEGTIYLKRPFHTTVLKPGTPVKILREGVLFFELVHEGGAVSMCTLMDNYVQLKSFLGKRTIRVTESASSQETLEAVAKKHFLWKARILAVIVCLLAIYWIRRWVLSFGSP